MQELFKKCGPFNSAYDCCLQLEILKERNKKAMNQAQKRKKKSAALAVVLAAALALTGTFAWQSISQVAKNEAKDVVNPGGRLHDNFNGYNVLGSENISGKTKDIFVENFTDPDNGGVPIYARVKLTEYMEIGEGAGDVKDDGTKADTNKAVPLVAGTAIDQPAGWSPYIPDKADDPFREYWELTTGGSFNYMPTFNKDKSSLEADINGTLAGKDGDPDSGKPYDDYENLVSVTKEANYGNGKVQEETHTRKRTATAKILTMDEWLAAGGERGSYWVFDPTDGWAYWASPINPGTETGCLLNDVTLTKSMDDSWYYSINATGQFATAFDWGDKAAGTGFYKDGETVSDNGLLLLNTIAGAHYMVVEDGETEWVQNVDKGETIDLKVYTREMKANCENVAWSIKEADKDGLTGTSGITEDGTLTIDANQAYETKFTVIAKSKVTGAELARKAIMVESDGLNSLRNIDAGSLSTANIDGQDWYVVAKKNGDTGKTDCLLWSKEMVELHAFDSNWSNVWGDDSSAKSSSIRTYLNGNEFLDKYPTIKELAKETTLTSRRSYKADTPYTNTAADFYTTTDKVFLLTEADIYGKLQAYSATEDLGAELCEQDYTYNGASLAAAGKPLVSRYMASCDAYIMGEGESGYPNYYWLRTPLLTGQYNGIVAQIIYTAPGYVSYNAGSTYREGVRPAMWISLTNY